MSTFGQGALPSTLPMPTFWCVASPSTLPMPLFWHGASRPLWHHWLHPSQYYGSRALTANLSIINSTYANNSVRGFTIDFGVIDCICHHLVWALPSTLLSSTLPMPTFRQEDLLTTFMPSILPTPTFRLRAFTTKIGIFDIAFVLDLEWVIVVNISASLTLPSPLIWSVRSMSTTTSLPSLQIRSWGLYVNIGIFDCTFANIEIFDFVFVTNSSEGSPTSSTSTT